MSYVARFTQERAAQKPAASKIHKSGQVALTVSVRTFFRQLFDSPDISQNECKEGILQLEV